MEYLNGGDLYSLLRNLGCLDEDVVRVYIAEIVSINIQLLMKPYITKACHIKKNTGYMPGACVGVPAFTRCGSP